MIRHHPSAAWILLLLAASSQGHADSVYKSVNEDGSVSYGDAPARGASQVDQVEILPPPSIDEVLEAKLTTERIKMAGDKLERERLAQEAIAEEQRMEREAMEKARANAAARRARMQTLAQQQAEEERRKKGKANSKPHPTDMTPLEDPITDRVTGPLPDINAKKPTGPIDMAPGRPLLTLPGDDVDF